MPGEREQAERDRRRPRRQGEAPPAEPLRRGGGVGVTRGAQAAALPVASGVRSRAAASASAAAMRRGTSGLVQT